MAAQACWERGMLSEGGGFNSKQLATLLLQPINPKGMRLAYVLL